MGVEYNQLGEECESRKANHKRGIHRGWDNNRRGKEREIEAGATMVGKFWSVTGTNWRWITKEPDCQVGRVNYCVSFTKKIVRQHMYSNRGRTSSVTTHITRSKINTLMFSRGKTPTGKHPQPQPTRPLGAVY
jgi:hypothetical protein